MLKPEEAPLVAAAKQWVADNYPYNSYHLLNTLEWLDRIAPGASEAVRLAALTHDMERAFPGPDQPAVKSLVDSEYHALHSARSARIVGDWLRGHGAFEGLASEVEALIRVHEDGGWPDANLVQAADSLSFLDCNIDLALGKVREGKWAAADVRAKFNYCYDRIQTPGGKELARPMLERARERLAELVSELSKTEDRRMPERDRIIDQFLGDDSTRIAWSGEEEKKLHFWRDDLHCPQPISPMWFDVGGWWLTCEYMFRRFGAPFGKDWLAKTVDEYVMSAVKPRDPKEEEELWPYYNMVMPVYAERFLGWWKTRYLPEILRNFEFLDSYPMEKASLAELMILLEDARDIQERHFRLHWILNVAQFQTSMNFTAAFHELVGKEHADLIGRILVSDEDRNWDSVRELWKLKERVKVNEALKSAFLCETGAGVIRALAGSDAGIELLRAIDAYRLEYGNRSMYTHEYLSTTWRENPTPIIEALRGYLASDYDFEKDVRQLRESRDAAIARMWELFPADRPAADRQRLSASLELALKMTPLTPDHHFYMDQGTYARVRLVFIAIGRELVRQRVLDEADDVLYLRYHELRVIAANPEARDAKGLVKERRRAREEAFQVRPRLWAGTITNWSLYEEPYKSLWGWPEVYLRGKGAPQEPQGTIRGLAASAGVVEGPARIVHSPDQFDQVCKGEVLVCTMTNPAWVVLFTKISALITDAGGALSHPAVVSREFGIPAVVGTAVATQRIQTGQRVRVNGSAGLVDILG